MPNAHEDPCLPKLAFGELARLIPVANDEELAARLGVSCRTVERWRKAGVGWVQADRVAVAVGLHPALVWDSWTHVADQGSRTLP